MSLERQISAELEETLERSALMAPAQRRGLGVALIAMTASTPWIGWHAVIPLVLAYIAFLVFKIPVVHRRLGMWALIGTWAVGELGMVATVLLGNGPADMMISMVMAPMIVGSVVYPKRFVLAGTTVAWVLSVVVGWLDDPAYFFSHPAGFIIVPVIAATIPLMVLSTRDAESRSRQESRIDNLTGVANRHALMVERDRLHTMGDPGAPLAIVLGDIDTFKAINDVHGHGVGDQVLREVARVMAQVVGANGQVFRYGGEEFLVALVGEAADQADAIAGCIRDSVSASPLAGVPTTISLGVASAPDGTRRFDELFERADSCLYAAKGVGGNQVRRTGLAVQPSQPSSAVPPVVSGGRRSVDTREVRAVLDREHLMAITERQMDRNLWAYGLILLSALLSLPIVGWLVLPPAVAGGVLLRVSQARVRSYRRPEIVVAVWWIAIQMLNLLSIGLARVSALQALTVVAPAVVGHYAALPLRIARTGLAVLGAMVVAAAFLIDRTALEQNPQVLVVALAIVASAAIAGRAVGDIAVQLRSEASHDPLTGLPNRYACFEALGQALARTRSTGGSVAVIVGDLDHFKRVNDEHGHATGDAVLAAVAERIAERIRPDVAFFRMGGEEFALIAPVSRARDAFDLAERLRLAVKRESLAGIDVTMSFGVTLAGAADRDPAAVFTNADDALYLAKRAGRDRVRMGVTSTEQVPEPAMAR